MGHGAGRQVGLATIGLAALLLSSAASACDLDVAALRGEFGTARFTIELADDDAERARGLMFVEQMPLMQGMLFAYDRPQRVSFWMRNTLIPLDMIFIGADGVVRSIHSNAQPLDETPIFGGDDIQFVLEVNGGMAERLGLEPGVQLQHPLVGPDAAWPC